MSTLQQMELRVENAYVGWIRHFILSHDQRPPAKMAEPGINFLLSHLAIGCHFSASTQHQAWASLLFLYRHVLNRCGRGVERPAGNL
jgi:hypothetical protein